MTKGDNLVVGDLTQEFVSDFVGNFAVVCDKLSVCVCVMQNMIKYEKDTPQLCQKSMNHNQGTLFLVLMNTVHAYFSWKQIS